MKGEIIKNIDVAQVVIWTFWVFFAYLVYWLRREDKREGYPLAYERQETKPYLNFPSIPPSKTFVLPHGGTSMAPRVEPPQPDIRAEPIAAWPGAPLEPIGDAMTSGAGPGAYALRSDTPDLNHAGAPKIVPLRAGGASSFAINPNDPDPRGMTVVGADGKSGGTVSDIWIDTCEVVVRYLEVTTTSGGKALVPMTFASINARKKTIDVDAILGSQFAGVPTTKDPDKVTFREEDKICAYFGGGTLYATPLRREALL